MGGNILIHRLHYLGIILLGLIVRSRPALAIVDFILLAHNVCPIS